MKKLLLLAATLLLTGCSVSFIRDSHEPGLDPASSTYQRNYSFYAGDSFDKSNLSAHEITFNVDEAEVEFSSDNQNSFTNYCVDNDHVITGVETIKDVSTFYNSEAVEAVDSGIKMGYPSQYVSGDLTLNLTVGVKAVEIYAYPRYGVVFNEQGSEVVIDGRTGISANGSRYIALKAATTLSELELTKCSYNFATAPTHLNINVYGERAVITKIVIYS